MAILHRHRARRNKSKGVPKIRRYENQSEVAARNSLEFVCLDRRDSPKAHTDRVNKLEGTHASRLCRVEADASTHTHAQQMSERALILAPAASRSATTSCEFIKQARCKIGIPCDANRATRYTTHGTQHHTMRRIGQMGGNIRIVRFTATIESTSHWIGSASQVHKASK